MYEYSRQLISQQTANDRLFSVRVNRNGAATAWIYHSHPNTCPFRSNLIISSYQMHFVSMWNKFMNNKKKRHLATVYCSNTQLIMKSNKRIFFVQLLGILIHLFHFVHSFVRLIQTSYTAFSCRDCFDRDFRSTIYRFVCYYFLSFVTWLQCSKSLSCVFLFDFFYCLVCIVQWMEYCDSRIYIHTHTESSAGV